MNRAFNNKYQIAEQGKALAAWLNSPESADTIAGFYIRCSLEFFYGPRSSFPLVETLRLDLIAKPPVTVSFRPAIREAGKRHYAFRLLPADENARWLLVWTDLFNSGNDRRLKQCANCKKVFYAAKRSDQKTCSSKCNVLLWQKTPKGREARRQYLRDHRARIREKERKQVLKGERRKNSRRILAGLGK